MKATIRYAELAILLILLFPCVGIANRKKVVMDWNKTNKAIPIEVKDSIEQYYKSIGKDKCPFVLYGTGVSQDVGSTYRAVRLSTALAYQCLRKDALEYR